MKIILHGANGRLGGAIAEGCGEKGLISAGVDINIGKAHDFPMYKRLSDVSEKADVIIDCSHHGAVRELLDYADKRTLSAVIATTGHNAEELAYIEDMSKRLPILVAANMSLGVNVLFEAAARLARLLGDSFDIEITETHHNKKIDAPSGTALRLAEAINGAIDEPRELVYDRTQRRSPRAKREIGMHTIRGGTVIGEHEVIFAGENEVLRLSHSAQSRGIYAEGALAAAAFIAGKPNGLYNMKDVVAHILKG